MAEYLRDLDDDSLYKAAVRVGITAANAKRMLRHSVSLCDEVVSAWLSRQDNVPAQCPPSWRNLEQVLRHRHVGQTGVANRLKKDKQIS